MLKLVKCETKDFGSYLQQTRFVPAKVTASDPCNELFEAVCGRAARTGKPILVSDPTATSRCSVLAIHHQVSFTDAHKAQTKCGGFILD